MASGAYSRELKKFGLKSGTKPQTGYPVSGVAVVKDEGGKGSCYIKFNEDFVEAIGKAMPHGVGADSPCYIKLLYMRGRKVWRVFACYIDESKSILLWETHDRPVWVKRIRRVNHDTSTQNAG